MEVLYLNTGEKKEFLKNVSSLEAQLAEVAKHYLETNDTIAKSSKGLPVRLTSSNSLVSSDYVLKISLERL